MEFRVSGKGRPGRKGKGRVPGSLKVKIVATEDSVDAVTADIVSRIGDLKEVSFTIDGNEGQLKVAAINVAKIISKHGKQKTLDLHFMADKEELTA